MPDRIVPRDLRSRLGRRGIILALFGLAWLIQASAYFVLGPALTSSDAVFWHEKLPPAVIGALWAVSGILSIAGAFTTKRQNDTFGFVAVSSMPMLLSASYFLGAVTRLLLGDPIWVLGVFGFSVWGVMTLALGVIASWHEEGGES